MKVGLIQQQYLGSKEKTIIYTTDMIKKAVLKGAKLVVLQELHQNEYFCQCEDTRFFDYAQSFNQDIQYWSKVAKENSVVLVTSLFENRADGIYHNTAVVFENDGSVAGKYRKMHIPDDPGFYEKFYFTPGDLGFEPIDTSVGRLGVLICWDQWYPEAARIMSLKGAEILIYPTAIGYLECPKDRVDLLCEKENTIQEKMKMREAWMNIQRSHAIANGIYVISVNRVGSEKNISKVLEGIEFWGHSFVCGPQGEYLYIAKDTPEVIVVDIDLQKAKDVRKIWPFFRDRRIESYECLQKRYCDYCSSNQ
jgi:N-carbamoylputrescine amidase